MILAVDIGGTKMACTLCDKANLEIVGEYRVPTGGSFTWQKAEEGIRTFLASQDHKFEGVGIAIPGLVNQTTVLKTADISGLEGWEPCNMVEFANMPVKMLNDAEAAGAEAYFGCGADETIATLVVGTGVGSSFLVDGRPLRGKNGYAGEIGACPIGGLGPVDYRAGGKWLLRDRMGDISPEEMVTLVAQEDPAALNAIKESGTNFGYILATVINLFNPGKIVLGGGTLRWPGYLDTALQIAKENSMDLLWQDCAFDVRDHLLVVKGAARAVSLILQEAK